jgi:hypothetical protein
MTESPTLPAPEEISHTQRIRQRIALSAGSIICGALGWWLARIFDIPIPYGRGGALLQQPDWAFAMGIVWIVILVGSAVTCFFASRQHYEGGLFCACVGLTLLSIRMGPTRFALFSSTSGAKVYLLMALELLLLLIAIAIGWVVLRLFARLGLIPRELPIDHSELDHPLDQKVLALTAQVVVSIILVLLLARSDDKAQVLAAVFFASYLAALAAHHFVPTQPSIWYWMGPLIVGVLGYVLQYFSPTDWVIGDARGFFASLARPMPLDYASLGTAGALLGYWHSRSWQARHAAEEEAENS